MGFFVDVPDIGAAHLLLLSCEERLRDRGDAEACLRQIERIAATSPYSSIRASASEILRQYREANQPTETGGIRE